MRFASFFCLRLALAGQPTTLNSMVGLPLAGACCRRFRVAWQSSEQLAACKLQVVTRYFRCYLIFGRFHAFCTLQARCASVSVAFLFRWLASSTRFYALLVTSLFHLAPPNSPSLRSDSRRFFCSCAYILTACLHLLTTPWLRAELCHGCRLQADGASETCGDGRRCTAAFS